MEPETIQRLNEAVDYSLELFRTNDKMLAELSVVKDAVRVDIYYRPSDGLTKSITKRFVWPTITDANFNILTTEMQRMARELVGEDA